MLNKIILMGRLTRDPELRRTQSGTAVTSFSLAVDRDFKEASGERATDFIDIVAWRNTAEFVSRYFAKGRMAVVEGRLQVRDWTDKDGGKRRSAEVIAENVYFGDSKKADSVPDWTQGNEDAGELPYSGGLMEHWAQKCDGAGVDPAEHAAVCKERDELKRELEETKELLEAAKNAQGLLQIHLVKMQEERDALLEIVRKSVEACGYCTHYGVECPCFDMCPPPDCDECTLEKAICCKCCAGSHFEFVGVEGGGGK